MAYTLISAVGTGMYKFIEGEEGYRETEYIFGNGKSKKTRLFIQAIMECDYRPIDQIILLGTDTSSWDYLVDKENEDRDSIIELWDSLFDQCEKKANNGQPSGVSRDNLDKLELYLSERFGVEVSILMHTHNIDNNTSLELFDCYTEATNRVRKDNNILFDITHGFRSMPVLLYQALQFSVSQNPNIKTVELVYGEYVGNQCSYVRDLSSYWYYSQISDALSVFQNKLDGYRLAELIQTDWLDGAKVIKKISDIVQTNFSLQIEETARQIKNALKNYPESAPEWLGKVKTYLEQFYSEIDGANLPVTLYQYAKYLFSLHLNTQAIITLQLAVETAIALKFGQEDSIGDYDWWQKDGRKKLGSLKQNNEDLKKRLLNLERFRNQIAHGGAKSKYSKGEPQAANIPYIFKSGISGVDKLFSILGL